TRAATGSPIPANPYSSRFQRARSASLPTERLPISPARPRQSAPPVVARPRASCTVIARGPFPARAANSAALISALSSPDSFEAEPSTPSPTGLPAEQSAPTGATPAPKRALDEGQ